MSTINSQVQVNLKYAGIFHSDTPATNGPADNFLYSIWSDPYLPFTGQDFLDQFEPAMIFAAENRNMRPDIDPNSPYGLQSIAAYRLIQDFGAFDYNVAAFLQNVPEAAEENVHLDSAGNPVISISNGTITASIFYTASDSRVIPESDTASISLTDVSGKQKTVVFSVESIWGASGQSAAASVVTYLYLNLGNIGQQIGPKLQAVSTGPGSGGSYKFEDLYNTDGTYNPNGAFACDIAAAVQQANEKYTKDMLETPIKKYVKFLITDVEFDLVEFAGDVASGMATAFFELCATYYYYFVVLPIISKPIALNLYIYNFSEADITFGPGYRDEGYLETNLVSYFGQPATNEQPFMTATQKNVLYGGKAGDPRVSYLGVRWSNLDGIKGVGTTMQFSWNDNNDVNSPQHSLELGIDIAYIETTSPRLRLDWGTNTYEWYEDDVEANSANDYNRSYWASWSDQTPVHPALTLLKIPGLYDSYVAVLYLCDGKVPTPSNINAIMQQQQPDLEAYANYYNWEQEMANEPPPPPPPHTAEA